MNKTTAVLGAALAISLILNVVAFRRGASAPTSPADPPARAAASEKAPAVASAPAEAVKAELERERKRAAELREQVRRLEAEKEVLAQAATSGAVAGAGAAKSATAGLKEKLRKMKKLFAAAEEGGQPDQNEVLEMTGEIMELMKLGLTRGKDPKTYAEFLQACTEVALEDKAALTPDQTAELQLVMREMADGLGRIPATRAGERLIQELEIEAAAMSRLQSLLTPEQKAAMQKGGMDDMPQMSTGMTTTYLAKANAVDMIVKQWTSSYKLQDAQLPAARAAAESYFRSLEGLDPGLKPGPQTAEANWGQLSYESRIASLRAQISSLGTLEGALTAEQLERLRTQAMREFRIMDFALPAAAAAPEK